MGDTPWSLADQELLQPSSAAGGSTDAAEGLPGLAETTCMLPADREAAADEEAAAGRKDSRGIIGTSSARLHFGE
jgi:hypothetical protein